jgi:two-component system chemotaxis response regulator CheY
MIIYYPKILVEQGREYKDMTSNIKILIVEDNDFMRKSIYSSIDGHKRFSAKNGLEAATIFSSEKPHIVFLDIGLPDASGLDLIRSFIDLDPSVHVVIVSGDDNANYKKIAKENGAKGYLVKPVSKNMLDEYITGFINEVLSGKK